MAVDEKNLHLAMEIIRRNAELTGRDVWFADVRAYGRFVCGEYGLFDGKGMLCFHFDDLRGLFHTAAEMVGIASASPKQV